MNSKSQKFIFKTNINCGGCVAVIKPHLDNTKGICEWNVDTASVNKILTVYVEDVTEEHLTKTIQDAGYKAEIIN